MVGSHARSRAPAGAPRSLLAVATAALLTASVAAAAATPPGRPPSGAAVPKGRSAPVPTDAVPTDAVPTDAGRPLPKDLAGHLLAPEDFGGYYRQAPVDAGVDLRGSRCLRAVSDAGRPAEQASTYLAVGNAGNVPAVLEVVDAYRSATAAAGAWSAADRALKGCATLGADLAGDGPITTRLQGVPPASLGLQAVGAHVRVERGTFHAGGFEESLEIAVVARDRELLVVVELDRVPPVPGSAIYDDFGSAVVTAYGKLA
ncbi:MAG: hypothetical protein ACYDEN_10175 [Acidimicrobiales bacterium]